MKPKSIIGAVTSGGISLSSTFTNVSKADQGAGRFLDLCCASLLPIGRLNLIGNGFYAANERGRPVRLPRRQHLAAGRGA